MNRVERSAPLTASASLAGRPRPAVTTIGAIHSPAPRSAPVMGRRTPYRPNLATRLATTARAELSHEHALLIPMRLFLGAGWLRAFAEKLDAPGWTDGAAVTAFLHAHMQAGDIVPAYAWLARAALLPNAAALGWAVLVGELLVGLSLVFGAATTAGLIGGLFMTLNFMAGGNPNPGAFYAVIQGALLVSAAGGTVAVDAFLARRAPSRRAPGAHPGLLAAAALVLLAAAGLAGARDFSAGGSVKDPGIVLAVVCFTLAGQSIAAWWRAQSGAAAPRR